MRRNIVLAAVLVLLTGCGHAPPSQRTTFRISGEKGIGPALALADVARESVRATSDPATGQPVVTFRLTPEGETKFARLTRALARRGAAVGRPFHLVIAVDGRVISRPYVDYGRNPQGIPGDNGVQLGTATIVDARRVAKALRG
ncbi:MAG: SecDF P1 head subdomain-containing protein [Gaiellaceae bacterium]